MRPRTPPALAVWMLSRLLRGRRGEALLGDLAEQYHRGSSRSWYWRQTLWAIAAQLRAHPPRWQWLGPLRLLIIAGLVAGSGLQWTWLIVLVALDPSFWWVLRRQRLRRSRGASRES